jgi:hypothetical protein
VHPVGSEVRNFELDIFKGQANKQHALKNLVSTTAAGMMPLQSNSSLCPVVGYKIFSDYTGSP